MFSSKYFSQGDSDGIGYNGDDEGILNQARDVPDLRDSDGRQAGRERRAPLITISGVGVGIDLY